MNKTIDFITKNKTNLVVNLFLLVFGLGFDLIVCFLGSQLTIEERWIFYCGIRCFVGMWCLLLLHSDKLNCNNLLEYMAFSIVVVGVSGVITIPLLSGIGAGIFLQHVIFFAGRVWLACQLKQKWGTL